MQSLWNSNLIQPVDVTALLEISIYQQQHSLAMMIILENIIVLSANKMQQ
jgi:hypothetical protein